VAANQEKITNVCCGSRIILSDRKYNLIQNTIFKLLTTKLDLL
jgi:hypothetical protein